MWELLLNDNVRYQFMIALTVRRCHLVFIIVEITIKTFRAIYIAKWRVFHASCVKVWIGAFPEGTRKYDPIWH